MLGKNKITITIIALVILAAAAYGAIRLLGSPSLAEGYLYEDENRLLWATVTPAGEQVNVELLETRVEMEDSIPVIHNNTVAYTGSMKGGDLHLQAQSNPAVDATVSGDELLFLGPLSATEAGGVRLIASQRGTYEEKRNALTNRVNIQAEQKKKEVAEKRAKEEARVEFAKKVEKTTKLFADLNENAKYLTDLQFSDELAGYNDQITSLHGLLDEVTSDAAQSDLRQMDYQVMVESVGSMKVLLDGLEVLDADIESKQKRMTDIMAVLETDLTDTKALWEEIKEAVPDAPNRLKAYNDAVKTASQAVEQAKERIASVQKEQSTIKKQAAQLYQSAVGIVNQTKAKHHFS